MKFSENWLRSHVPIQASRDELAATLTAIGLEVEEVTPLGEALGQVVVARIVEAVRHPEADRLQVCSVDAGQGELLQIVCGAPNARAGLVAPLALVGAQVGALTITAAKLRGVASNGMLCSAKELGLDSDASGLFELPDDAPVGQALAEYLGLPDASIEIKLTPNRADCFSVRGIAFDVAAACASTVVAFEAGAVAPVSTRTLAVELHAGNAAPRYCGRVIEGIDPAAKTPVWLAERLRRSGVRPVSLLVDITQYVMLELGQPMHAFDLDTLQGPIGVRHSRSGEQLALLDGRQVTLDDSFLTITDADRPVALAGLMGGLDTRVTDTTRNVFLESAYFDPAAIMGRGRKFGLHTDAGHRFERGVDPALPPQAIEVATRLVLELAGGTPGPVVHAQLPEHLPQPARILLRRARIVRVLGIQIDDAEVVRILGALGMQLEAVAEGWQVMAPSRRFDIAIEEDLIEELARIHGYDRVPTTLPGGASRIAMPSETQLDELSVRRQLVARELQETINYAFVDATLLERWQLTDGLVPLANPLSAELAIMRPRLLPGLVATLGRNAARQAGRVRLFELGKVFAAASDAGAAPQESQHVAAAVCGDALALQWGEPARKVDFHDLKGDLMALAAASGAVLEFQPSAQPFGHPGRSADIHRDGVCIGWIGQVHPRLAKALDIDVDVIAFELQLTALVKRALPRAGELSRFPSVRRDLAFLVPEEVSWAALSSSVRTTVGPLLREVQLFDRYVGQGVEPGFKSLAMGLILQDNSRTLTDRDVDAVVADVVTVIEREHRARIRS
ncbi:MULTISPECIES: phenylalanine--tRNA ligase subunit beta [Xanthomonas]|uniref:Phenylalanine--tRNA ligase beta subunit n=1 Tax=Xanthomonas arboricola TaxID=56448 RepID=A0AB73GVX8_9XANT|nr:MULTISPECIES: phenylalanine--tRNA ligase subunit beta [Xanthomonas]MBB3796585.1 phenylalanyl-tRNA synthetase beta chain [Xanthomonas arboricola]MBB4769547.1 phenylalanyl-tRNA synthetase beta chain [Xanthomonas arboricola]MBB5669354.1 phenylalanyl-tRNA synthetase beta chain [Xanthomonas arboricola]MXV45699.1 phenylalanine--tRNA ligase subunit beta [Xanthomonas sp. LMG 8993]QWN00034.1 phenylalanine--tRNA ligase subunit beta [Xanthomonas sp. MLO165]